MDKIEILDMCAYIGASKYRSGVMGSLYGEEVYKTPIQISNECNIRSNHISKTLGDLKKKKLIKCINEERRKGRLYCLTEQGKQVCGHMILETGTIYQGGF